MKFDENGKLVFDDGGYDKVLSGDTSGKALSGSFASDAIGSNNAMNFSDVLSKNMGISPKASSGFFDKAFETPGATIGGIGAVVSGIGSIYAAKLAGDYQKKVFKMEEDRVNDTKARQAKQQIAFDKVWN